MKYTLLDASLTSGIQGKGLRLLLTAGFAAACAIASAQYSVQEISAAPPNSGFEAGITIEGANAYLTYSNFSGPHSGIYSVPTSGGSPTLLYGYPGSDGFNTNAFGITSDGTYLYWADPNSGPYTDTQIFKMPLGGGSVTAIYTGSAEGQPIFDGNAVAYVNGLLYVADEAYSRLYTMNPDGSNIRFVGSPTGGIYESDPFLAVQGNTIYEAFYSQTTGYIYSISAGGGPFNLIYSAPASQFDPRGLGVGNGLLYFGMGNSLYDMPITGGAPSLMVDGSRLGNALTQGVAYSGGSIYLSNAVGIYKINAVPEPAPIVMLGGGLLGLLFRKRKSA